MCHPIPKPLRGIVPPMITPLLAADTLDSAGLERLVEHILTGGVEGLFILGTTGEAPALSYRLRGELIASVCRLVDGRVPVLVGITDCSQSGSLDIACAAANAGAAALVVAPPFYFGASQAELTGYFERLISQLPLPVFLYNQPGNTRHVIGTEMARRLADMPAVLGIKDSSLDMMYFQRLARLFRDRPEFTLLVGPEELLVEAVLLGGHGGICGGANICPNLYVDAYRAAAAGDLETANRLHQRIIDISATVYRVTQDESSYLRGLKCAVSLKGVCGDFMAEPIQPFGDADRAEVRRRMVAARLLEA
jgi:4-hydroxy-tetrahydrodipicolinate synthase